MQLLLAPMEGVVNARMRSLLTSLGGIDRCVTEFVRVTEQRLPRRVFLRYCPELLDGGRTPSGTPVYLQLLGSNPEALAVNARIAAQLGAPGIDLNFGCPAKTVNKNRGGSVLLQEPELIGRIVSQVRDAVPADIPVTAKIRLGYQDDSLLPELVEKITTAGATELIIHARTKVDGYKPPAHWHKLKPYAERRTIPLIANGEIWHPTDYLSCRQHSGCADVMIGRGLLASPGLPQQIKALGEGRELPPLRWEEILPLLQTMLDHLRATCSPRHVGGPLKQWLGYLRLQYPQAAELFVRVKRLTAAEDLQAALNECALRSAA